MTLQSIAVKFGYCVAKQKKTLCNVKPIRVAKEPPISLWSRPGSVLIERKAISNEFTHSHEKTQP